MGPKGRGGPAEKVEARNVVQAVVLADSFTQRFRPITVERPKVLLPLVNVPMIEYTLEWLASNRVQEVFVFCCAHADQIKNYIASSKWAKCKDMSVTTVVSTSCISVGEALRLIDNKECIQNDFILVSGDTVANVNLAPVLAAHRARREVDKQAIFTMVMKSTKHPQQRLRLGDNEISLVLDPASNRMLKFHESDGLSKRPVTFKVDTALFSERDNIQVRTDLMDTHISICAPEVLMLFTDNFDFANLKRDFIPGVLSEEELGSKLYIHEVEQSEYAAHIHNLRSYDAVSRDIMQRWCFPMVPDTNILYKGGPWGPSSYRYQRGHRYLENSVHVARTARLGEDVCVGANTAIGDGSSVVQSVIGRGCRIGKNASILGCYVQDNVTIQDGVKMQYALVCEHAVIQTDAVLSPGSVVSYNVVVGSGHTVPANARISLCRQIHHAANLSDDELEYVATPPGTANKQSVQAAVAAAKASQALADASEDEDHEEEEDTGFDDYDDDSDILAHSLEKPTEAAIKMAQALAHGKSAQSTETDAVQFDDAMVGRGGAGYRWLPSEVVDLDKQLITPPSIPSGTSPEEEAEVEEIGEGAAVITVKAAAALTEEEEAESEEPDPEVHFKLEVAETFLRSVKLKYEQANAIIELNGLKIAEDRTFADLAKYIFTTLLAMCLPAPNWVAPDYLSQFPARGSPLPAPVAMLTSFRKLLRQYKDMLKKFLRTTEDQVELLLTLEEYCSEEGAFERQGEHGHAYADVFGKVMQLLYDEDVLEEEAVDEWEEAKQEDEEEDRVYLQKAQGFLEWLRTAEEDDDDDEDEDDD